MSLVKRFKGALKSNARTPTQWKDEENKVIFEDDLVNQIVDEYTERRKDRRLFELQWILNMNFNEGNQYVELDTQSMKIVDTPRFAAYQEMEALNQIAPIVETRLSKLKRLNLSLKTRPATNDSADVSRAKISNKVLEGIGQDKQIPYLQNIANMWAEVTGTAVWWNMWNPNAGRLIGDLDGYKLYEGDLVVEVSSPFEIFPDSLWNQDIKQCQSIIRAKVIDAKIVEATYEKEIGEGKEVSVFASSSSAFSIGGGLQKSGSYAINSRKKKGSVEVLYYYERPSRLYPDGRFIVCTDEVLLYSGTLPYKTGEEGQRDIPCMVQKCIDKEGQFFGKAIVDRLIPVQRRYNAIKNRKAEYLSRATIGNLVYEEGTIDDSVFTVTGLAPGDALPIATGTTMQPFFLQVPPLPTAFAEEELSYMQLFNVLSGVSEISRDSSAPTGINSGIGLQVLQEQDDTRLSKTAENIRLSMIENAKQWLRLYRQFAKTPRMVKSTGKDARYDVMEWTGSDLNSDDIFIEASSLMAETLAQRRQMVFDLLNTGLFNDPETGKLSKEGRAKVFELIEMGNWESYDDGDNNSLHFQKAQREMRRLLQGEPIEVQDFDDDILHIDRHNAFRLGSEYEEIMDKTPEIAELIDQHIEEHIAAIQRKAMAAQGQGGNNQDGEPPLIQPSGDAERGGQPVIPADEF